LKSEWDLADLVEEKRSARGRFEEAAVVAVGTCKSAPHVAEQLALEEVLGSAPQLTGLNGPRARRERAWMVRATRSLPEPLSPVSSTGVSVRATRSASARTFFMARLRATSAASARPISSEAMWRG